MRKAIRLRLSYLSHVLVLVTLPSFGCASHHRVLCFCHFPFIMQSAHKAGLLVLNDTREMARRLMLTSLCFRQVDEQVVRFVVNVIIPLI